MEALNHFSQASRLVANMEKSSLFMAGVDEPTKEALLQQTDFSQGQFPMRYLVLPLSPKKWNKIDCKILVDKITSKINTGYSRKLSYAGRLQVLNVIVFSIYNFWRAVFILPQSDMKETDRRCKGYLCGTMNRRGRSF